MRNYKASELRKDICILSMELDFTLILMISLIKLLKSYNDVYKDIKRTDIIGATVKSKSIKLENINKHVWVNVEKPTFGTTKKFNKFIMCNKCGRRSKLKVVDFGERFIFIKYICNCGSINIRKLKSKNWLSNIFIALIFKDYLVDKMKTKEIKELYQKYLDDAMKKEEEKCLKKKKHY